MGRNGSDGLSGGTVTIRALGAADREAVERLAQRDSARVPAEPLLGVEVAGRLAAVTSLAGGETIADPFSLTDGARAMLELRASELRGGNGRGWRLGTRLPGRPKA